MSSVAAIALILAIPAVALSAAILVYNRLALLARRCEQASADIDAQLRHRHDLIPGLVETVRSFAAHERGLVETVARARARALRAMTPREKMAAENDLTASIVQLLSVAEAYPTAQASAHYTDLRADLADVTNKITAARRFLNLAVREYNATLDQFPANVIGPRFGMRERKGYDLGMERVFLEDAPAVRIEA